MLAHCHRSSTRPRRHARPEYFNDPPTRVKLVASGEGAGHEGSRLVKMIPEPGKPGTVLPAIGLQVGLTRCTFLGALQRKLHRLLA
jgi:hypothetical protein